MSASLEKFTLTYNIVNPQVRSILITEKTAGIPLNKNKTQDIDNQASRKYNKIKNKESLIYLQNKDHSIVPIKDFHAICTYLSNVSETNHSLYPTDALKRAKIDDYIYIHAQDIVGCLQKYLEPIHIDNHKIDNGIIYKIYQQINLLLEDGRLYIAGDEFTIADLFYIATVHTLNIFVPLSGIDDYDNIKQWFARVLEHPSYTNEIMEDVICSYLTERSDINHPLYAHDTLQRAEMDDDIFVIAQQCFDSIQTYLEPINVDDHKIDDGIIYRAYNQINSLFEDGRSEFIAGDKFTIADIFFIATVFTFNNFVPFSGASDCDDLKNWYTRVLEEKPDIKEINNDPENNDEFYNLFNHLFRIKDVRKKFENFSKIFIKPEINTN